eukprot:15434947-Alexandrium_andersonii.AAC.1
MRPAAVSVRGSLSSSCISGGPKRPQSPGARGESAPRAPIGTGRAWPRTPRGPRRLEPAPHLVLAHAA